MIAHPLSRARPAPWFVVGCGALILAAVLHWPIDKRPLARLRMAAEPV